MLALYIVTAIIGGGLMLLSAVGGLGSHADVSHDLGGGHDFGGHDVGGHDVGGHDVGGHEGLEHGGHGDHEHGGEGGLWIPFLSLRFWTYAIGTFGILGLLLTLFSDAAEPGVGMTSGVLGFVMGLVAAYGYRLAQRSQTSGGVSERDFLGVEGKVLVATKPDHPGKVRVTVKDDIIDMLALSEGGKTIEVGEDIVVVAVEGDQVRIAKKGDILE